MPRLAVASETCPPVSGRAFVVGTTLLVLGATSSLLLTLDHLGSFDLPGCGWESACRRAASSVWASVPGLKWPISFVGFSYLVAALVAWIFSRKGLAPLFQLVVNLAGIVSAAFLLLMLVERFVCVYCLAVHLGNLGFWIVVRRQPVVAGTTRRSVLAFLVAILTTTGALAGAQWLQEERTRANDERALDQWIEEAVPLVVAPPPPEGEGIGPGGGLVGRYPWGPGRAPVRLVLFTDYQCKGCMSIDQQVQTLRETRPEVSISIKHFPMCSDCNHRLTRSNPHPNACWAARAAEAAGILHNTDGFWRMHDWLQANNGTFTNQELQEGLGDLGFAGDEFVQTMADVTTFIRVQADAAEALRLGLESTPTVFLNGIPLDGVFAENAILRAVDAVLAKRPPSGTASADRHRVLADHDRVPPESKSEVDAVAHVAGESISRSDLGQVARAQGHKPDELDHDLLCKLLDMMASEKMLAIEAAKRSLTIEQLIRAEVDDKVLNPTSRDVEEYAAQVWDYRSGIPREELRTKLLKILRYERLGERAQCFFSELAKAYDYSVMLIPPRFEVTVPKDAPSRGSQDALITIVEFADFECSFCRRLHQAVERLLEEYCESIRYVFQDYPPAHHPRALPASLAARCAGEQDRFWEYFNNLMTIPGDLGEEDLIKRALAVGLDVDQFRTCDRASHRRVIEAAIKRGEHLGVTATPTLFINGRRLVGERSYSDLKGIIEEELARVSPSKEVGMCNDDGLFYGNSLTR